MASGSLLLLSELHTAVTVNSPALLFFLLISLHKPTVFVVKKGDFRKNTWVLSVPCYVLVSSPNCCLKEPGLFKRD